MKRSITARERCGDRRGLAICLNNIAQAHTSRGDYAAAQERITAALETFEAIGDSKGVIIAGCNLGESLTILGQFDAARDILDSTIQKAEAAGFTLAVQTAKLNLGTLETQYGDYDKALKLLKECSTSARTPNEFRATLLGALAEAHLRLGETELANDTLREGEELTHEIGSPKAKAILAAPRVRLLLERAEPEAAESLGKRVFDELSDRQDHLLRAVLTRELARVYRELGPDWADLTEKHFGEAISLFAAMQSPHNIAEAELEFSIYWRYLGEDSAAESHAAEATRHLNGSVLTPRLGVLFEPRRIS